MLTDVSSLGHTTSKKLKFLFLINNLLPELPVMDLPELYLIYFMKNKITSLTNLSRSNLPELRRLQGSHNQIQGVLPIMKFPQLELLNLDYNRI
jgi:Leucine-rich repeat (LRR) protein